MSNNIQFETDDYEPSPTHSGSDHFKIVEWLQKKGIVQNKSEAYWIVFIAVAIMLSLSVYFFSVALGGGGSSDEVPIPATTTEQI